MPSFDEDTIDSFDKRAPREGESRERTTRTREEICKVTEGGVRESSRENE